MLEVDIGREYVAQTDTDLIFSIYPSLRSQCLAWLDPTPPRLRHNISPHITQPFNTPQPASGRKTQMKILLLWLLSEQLIYGKIQRFVSH